MLEAGGTLRWNRIPQNLAEFSAKSLESVYNRKEVDLDSVIIAERTIVFTLYSAQELPVLGKSIRLFSQLLSTELYFEPMVIKHKLFKTFVPAENVSDTDEKTVIDASTVTDTELVIGLVKMLLKPEYSISTSMRNAIEKMMVWSAWLTISKNRPNGYMTLNMTIENTGLTA